MATIMTLGRQLSVRFRRTLDRNHAVDSEKNNTETLEDKQMMHRKSFSINDITEQTKFTREEIKFIYKGFKEVNFIKSKIV